MDPYHDNLTHSIELIQNNSCRFILWNYNRMASASSMKSHLGLESLATRRKISRLSFFHKLYHHPTLHPEFMSRPYYLSHRIDHQHKVRICACNTTCFSESFIPRTSREWNDLPADIVSIVNNEKFRKALANIV